MWFEQHFQNAAQHSAKLPGRPIVNIGQFCLSDRPQNPMAQVIRVFGKTFTHHICVLALELSSWGVRHLQAYV